MLFATPKRIKSCQVLFQHTRCFTPVYSARYENPEEVKNIDVIESNLEHGKVTLWTRGDHCPATGSHSRKIKKLLSKNNIEF
jgi:hypothetical protein